MSTGQEKCVSHEILLGEVNSQTRHLKEEIRATFSAHAKSLALREQWLLDQADSIKEGLIAMITQKHVSSAQDEAKSEMCAYFSKMFEDHGFDIGLQHTAQLKDQLRNGVTERCASKVSLLPAIEFLDDRKFLHNAIMSYGRLHTSDCIDIDDHDTASEKSWDLVDEKGEIMQHYDNPNPLATADCGTLSDKNRCNRLGHCLNVAIEDMDFTDLLNTSSDSAEEGSCEDMQSTLKLVCKANEVCGSISECLCSNPCLKVTASSKSMAFYDPVAELQSKLSAVFDADPGSKTYGFPCERQTDSEGMVFKTEPNSCTGHCDLVDQVSLRMQDILGSPRPNGKADPSMGQGSVLAEAHAKIQKILSFGIPDEECYEKFCFEDGTFEPLSYRTLPWEGKKMMLNCGGTSDDNLFLLSKNLSAICQDAGGESHRKGDMEEHQTADPILFLASRLQHVLAC